MSTATFVYNIFIYTIGIPLKKILTFFLPKLREREQNWRKSIEKLEGIKPLPGRRIWVHSASMGEFEQAKPIIEHLKRHYDNLVVICSFYSPSGFNTQINYPYADAIVYMPFDTKANAKEFIDLINPEIAVFVRYEAWRNHLSYLRANKISTLLINATSPKNTFWNNLFFTKMYYKSTFSLFDIIFTVGVEHSKYFDEIDVDIHVISLSDTRFDRIIEKVDSTRQNKLIPRKSIGNALVFVAGSTWEADEDVILKALENLDTGNLTCILVPHEPTKEHISQLQAKLTSSTLLSEIEKDISNGKEIFIKPGSYVLVDSIGKLLQLYGNADFAYIGGAFGVGVHSLSEPAGYGIPLACGPECLNSPDAEELLASKALHSFENDEDLAEWFREMLENDTLRIKLGKASAEYITQRTGTTKIIAETIIGELTTNKRTL